MQNFFDVVQTRTGDAISGASVSVYAENGSLAYIYSDNGTTLQTNPMTTNDDGEYSFYAADGRYSLTITATGYDTQTRAGIILYDAAAAQPISNVNVQFPTTNDVLAWIDNAWRNTPWGGGLNLLPLDNTWTGLNTWTQLATFEGDIDAGVNLVNAGYVILTNDVLAEAGKFLTSVYLGTNASSPVTDYAVTGYTQLVDDATLTTQMVGVTSTYRWIVNNTPSTNIGYLEIGIDGNIKLPASAATISDPSHLVPKSYLDAHAVTTGSVTTSGLTMSTARILGRTTASTGAVEELTVGAGLTLSAGALGRPALTGDVTASADSNATTIANSVVTNAKLANMANSTIKGRTTAGTGVPEDMTAAQTAAIVQGDGLTVDLCGFRGVPLNSQSANYTTVAADAGKTIDHPASDANARQFTIAANASVAYPVGTTLTFTNMSANALTIAINSDTMYLAGAGTTGSRTLAQYGVATALKLTSTTWLISGTNLT